MPSDREPFSEQDRIDQEAAEWFIKKDRGLNAAEERAFKKWLAADARHESRLDWHASAWERFDPIEEGSTAVDSERADTGVNEASRGPRGLAKTFLSWPSLAALLVIGFLGWAAVAFLDKGEDLHLEGRFVADAYVNRILADGTIVEMNEGARLKVVFTNVERRVWLHDGEAYFRVAKDEKRPFVVHAGEAKVRAIGTEFNVRYQADSIQVLVTEGRINLSKVVAQTEAAAKPHSFSRELDAGEVSTIRNTEEPVVVTVTHSEIDEILSWKPKTLEFISAPLGDVVTAFNKRNQIQITLSDEELETMPVVVTFHSDNVLAFTRLLELSFDLKANRVGQDEILITRPQ